VRNIKISFQVKDQSCSHHVTDLKASKFERRYCIW